jgi:hypothetical protein
MSQDQAKLTPVGWARVWPAAKPSVSRSLRKGAWYPVLQDDEPSRVVLDIGGHQTLVPRRLLEIREGFRRPKSFAVVHRTQRDMARARAVDPSLGPVYAVCPECRERQPLEARPDETRCPHCGFSGEVAWWEIE